MATSPSLQPLGIGALPTEMLKSLFLPDPRPYLALDAERNEGRSERGGLVKNAMVEGAKESKAAALDQAADVKTYEQDLLTYGPEGAYSRLLARTDGNSDTSLLLQAQARVEEHKARTGKGQTEEPASKSAGTAVGLGISDPTPSAPKKPSPESYIA